MKLHKYFLFFNFYGNISIRKAQRKNFYLFILQLRRVSVMYKGMSMYISQKLMKVTGKVDKSMTSLCNFTKISQSNFFF